MNNRSFRANNWLDTYNFQTQEMEQNELPPIPEAEVTQPHINLPAPKRQFTLGHFLNPDWKGESLFSKEAMKLKRLFELLLEDAQDQIEKFENRNRSSKISIYNEFLSYAHEMGINDLSTDTFNEFWAQYSDPYASDLLTINNFKKIFAFRAVSIYFFKTRFIALLDRELLVGLNESDYLTPDYFLGKIFKKGSSKEIDSEALQTNQYSWYRPNSKLKNKIFQSIASVEQVSLAEVLKLCRPSTFSLEAIAQKEYFSHSLSTKSFGLFLNQLMIELPAWLQGRKIGESKFTSNGLSALSTLYSGQFLHSISCAHWLAQEHNSNIKWWEILCPDFFGEGYTEGSYLKICHELHFLSFLVEVSKKQGHRPDQLICSIYKQRKIKSTQHGNLQFDLFADSSSKDTPYDRILLNLVNMPKKNPHHFLVNKLTSSAKNLSSSGFLYVLSNQKLFVPSQSEKVEQVLDNYKVEASFNFEDLKGKGEIPNFLYVITQRKDKAVTNFLTENKTQKESLLSFRLSGQLSQFSKFSSYVNELFKFFKVKKPQSTPVYQVEPADSLTLEFHQDAILEGKVLSSTTNLNGQHTHPNYFKNLMKSCAPLDQFFIIENMQNETSSNKNITSELLGITFKHEERFPILLIVDYTNEAQIRLEITTSDLYKVKLEQYGQAYFQYFGLIPKRTDTNINLFREFFNTSIGNQVIQLCLNGGLTKIKSKLRSLLIPKFFMNNSVIPKHIEPGVKFLQKTSRELLDTHPDHIEQELKDTTNYIHTIGKKYPWHTLSLLSNFKYDLESCLRELESDEVNFYNPIIKAPLCKLETFPVYPNNREVYLSIEASDTSKIYGPLLKTINGQSENGDFLDLISNENECVARFYSEPELLAFIKFVLSCGQGMPISKLIQALKVPKHSEIKAIMNNYKNLFDSIEKSHSSVNQIIGTLLTSQISTH